MARSSPLEEGEAELFSGLAWARAESSWLGKRSKGGVQGGEKGVKW